MKTLIKPALICTTLAVAGSLSLASVTPAAAAFDRCKNVSVTVTNMTGGPVQLFDVDYWDYGSNRKRSKNVRNLVLGHGDSRRMNLTLNGVNNARTYLTVQYRKLKSNGRWNLTQWWNARSNTALCRRGTRFSIRFQ